MMRKTILAVIAIGGWLFCNCSGKQTQVTEMNDDSLKVSTMTGDSAIYGLACDGCTDSVIVLLPHDGSDPVTYDILKAMRNKRVIGPTWRCCSVRRIRRRPSASSISTR